MKITLTKAMILAITLTEWRVEGSSTAFAKRQLRARKLQDGTKPVEDPKKFCKQWKDEATCTSSGVGHCGFDAAKGKCVTAEKKAEADAYAAEEAAWEAEKAAEEAKWAEEEAAWETEEEEKKFCEQYETADTCASSGVEKCVYDLEEEYCVSKLKKAREDLKVAEKAAEEAAWVAEEAAWEAEEEEKKFCRQYETADTCANAEGAKCVFDADDEECESALKKAREEKEYAEERAAMTPEELAREDEKAAEEAKWAAEEAAWEAEEEEKKFCKQYETADTCANAEGAKCVYDEDEEKCESALKKARKDAEEAKWVEEENAWKAEEAAEEAKWAEEENAREAEKAAKKAKKEAEKAAEAAPAPADDAEAAPADEDEDASP